MVAGNDARVKRKGKMPLPNAAELKRLKEEVEKNRPKPTHVEPGLYLARCASAVEKKSRKSGLPMISAEFRLVQVPGKPKVHKFIMCEGAGSFMYWDFLAAIGWTGEESDESDIEMLVGRTCNVELIDAKTDDGIAKSEIKKFTPSTNGDSGSQASIGGHPVSTKKPVTEEKDDIDLGAQSGNGVEVDAVSNDIPDDQTAAELAEAERKLNELRFRKKTSSEVAKNIVKRVQDAAKAAQATT